jgi:hypothetical protein
MPNTHACTRFPLVFADTLYGWGHMHRNITVQNSCIYTFFFCFHAEHTHWTEKDCLCTHTHTYIWAEYMHVWRAPLILRSADTLNPRRQHMPTRAHADTQDSQYMCIYDFFLCVLHSTDTLDRRAQRMPCRHGQLQAWPSHVSYLMATRTHLLTTAHKWHVTFSFTCMYVCIHVCIICVYINICIPGDKRAHSFPTFVLIIAICHTAGTAPIWCFSPSYSVTSTLVGPSSLEMETR